MDVYRLREIKNTWPKISILRPLLADLSHPNHFELVVAYRPKEDFGGDNLRRQQRRRSASKLHWPL